MVQILVSIYPSYGTVFGTFPLTSTHSLDGFFLSLVCHSESILYHRNLIELRLNISKQS